jgi:hypothetical protein
MTDDPAQDLLCTSLGALPQRPRQWRTALKRIPGAARTAAATDGPTGVTAAATERGRPMVRKWVSDPYLAPFAEPTGDGRIFKVGSLHARELPLPLLFQESSGWGHEGSAVVGRILEIEFTDAGIKASGDYLDDESVQEMVEKAVTMASQGLGHVSVDLAAVTAELVDEDGNPVDWDDLFDAWDRGEDLVVLEQVTDGELIATTQVATPAFASAKIKLVAALMDSEGVDIGIGDVVDVETEDAGTIRGRVTAVDEASETVTVQPTDEAGADAGDPISVAPAAVKVVNDVDEPTETAPGAAAQGTAVFAADAAGTEITVGDTVVTDLRDESGEVTEAGVEGTVTAITEASGDVPAMVTMDRTDGGAAVSVPAANVTVTQKAAAATDEPPDGGDQESIEESLAAKAPALVAGAGPIRPKKEWFAKQNLPGPTAMTITEDGQIYGHVAQWGQCHVGFANTCWTAPESQTDYAYFHVGEVVCDDGSHVAVGNITLGPRHANERMGYRAAVEHYDQAAAGVGVARCYEDEFGIQFAGAVTPGTTEEQLYDMRRCPVSGDWRKVGGNLELIGVLSVNSGGYPTPRFATDDYGRTALVAAPGVPVAELSDKPGTKKRRPAGLTQAQIMARIKAEVKAELLADERRRTRLARVAASIRRDPKSRIAELAGRVDR